MATYFVVYTIDGDFATATETVDAAINSDPPVETPTIAELRERIFASVRYLMDDYDDTSADPRITDTVNEIIEIVTLGNVTAGGES